MIRDDILKYKPGNAQEEADREQILRFLGSADDAFSRSNKTAHMTASSWIINRDGTKVLMVYHRIYDSWSWTGGHADDDEDLLAVAMREAREETGVESLCVLGDGIFSLEVLTVDGHEKRGEYVPSHLHMNVTYLLQADENDALHICEDENSGVAWFTPEAALEASTEPWFVERIYKKLVEKTKKYI